MKRILGRSKNRKIIPIEMRQCIVTRESQSKTDMIRFVVGPDGQVFPDLLEKLPGRGVWVTAKPEIVAQAIKQNSFERALKTPAKVPTAMQDSIEAGLAKQLTQLLSLFRKSGTAIAGFEKVKSALVNEEANLLLQAIDGSDAQKSKLRPPKGENKFISCLKSDELGLAFGREHVIHAAILKHPNLRRFKREASRLSAMRSIS